MSSQGFDHLRRHPHHHHLRPHHHHCHGVLSYCAFHNHYFHCHCHRQGSNIVTPLPPPQNQSFVSFTVGNDSTMVAAEHKAVDGDATQISKEQEHLELDEEEDEEPIFVLTDEWRDFFAESEARRQQEKLLRKKGKK
ncbi:hypothetical protein K1719_040782 [Acacia pycnantha]|nr:hypothetical protein K1719_040782 [Acacia pycnantha]